MSTVIKPTDTLGQINERNASLVIPNQMNPIESNQPAAPVKRICANPRIPPTGPNQLSPLFPLSSAKLPKNPQLGKSAGL